MNKELEEMLYNLNIVGDIIEEDSRYKLIIAKTIMKLPKDVKEKALNCIYIITTKDVLGYTHEFTFQQTANETIKKRVVVLNFSEMNSEPEDYIMSVVAHEIAHIILGDIGGSSDVQAEEKADKLIEKWSFKKVY